MHTSPGDAALADLDIELSTGRPAIAVAHGVSGRQAMREWLAGHRDAIRAGLHRFGSLLVRGLPMSDVDDFATARDELLDGHLQYRERSTPRSELSEGVYTSTDMPARHPIRLHNESSYVVRFPGILLFGCAVAPTEAGATTVGDSREVLARLDPELVGRFRTRGWTLRRNYHPSLSLSWSNAFGTDDRAELAEILHNGRIAWEWQPDGSLRTSQRRAAVLRHPDTGEETWFNHVAFWNRHTMNPDIREALLESYGEHGLPYDTCYGDGEPVTQAEAEHLNAVYDEVERRETYRAGDLLLVDNMLSCHGREPYRGDRKILVAMGEPRDVLDCAPDVLPAPGPMPG
ncbi:TauD/TfdA family dioxygenase [Actinophytocola sp.]|uniref:TauD/TfdA family dioxygenase n=1 Tax=Actinophytocola sp. TaxID=1872138 RepID=UPI003899FF4F